MATYREERTIGQHREGILTYKITLELNSRDFPELSFHFKTNRLWLKNEGIVLGVRPLLSLFLRSQWFGCRPVSWTELEGDECAPDDSPRGLLEAVEKPLPGGKGARTFPEMLKAVP